MFCNACGTELEPGFSVCPKCATPTRNSISSPTAAVARSRLQRHLNILGVLWIIVGVLFLIPATVLLFLGGAVSHFVIHDSQVATLVGPLVLTLIGGSILLVGVGGILVGWGLRDRQPWARVTAIVLGIFALFHPPLGTALGIYTLWVLLSEESGTEYRQLSAA
jgi:hypothetical protein